MCLLLMESLKTIKEKVVWVVFKNDHPLPFIFGAKSHRGNKDVATARNPGIAPHSLDRLRPATECSLKKSLPV